MRAVTGRWQARSVGPMAPDATCPASPARPAPHRPPMGAGTPHFAGLSPAESSLTRLVEMVADQLPKRSRIVELELDRERHDAAGDALTAAQARKILFRRHQRELLALCVRSKSGDLIMRKHVVVGEGTRARDLYAAGT